MDRLGDVACDLSYTWINWRKISICHGSRIDKSAVGTDVVLISTKLAAFSSDALERLLSLGVCIADLRLRG